MIDLDKLAEDWPSPFVARCKISEFTHGLYKQSSMNTFDARGDGISHRYKIGSKIFYRVDDVTNWLKKKKLGE